MTLPDWFHATIDDTISELESHNLLRRLSTVQGKHGTYLTCGGSLMVNLASNNPLGLASHPRVRAAAASAANDFGVGGGASRLVSGNTTLHDQLENEISKLKGTESSLVFPTGYMANVGTISALAGPRDLIVMDKLCHASMFDGARLSGARVRTYPHCDMERLAVQLVKESERRKFVLTDSLFSMDGDLAPLKELVSLCQKYDAVLIVDEAHATGVMGKKGRGALEEAGVEEEVSLVIGTLSKAIGAMGGFVCGDEKVVSFLKNRARSFIYTTSLALPVAAAATEAIRLIEEDPALGRQARENALLAYSRISELGYRCSPPNLPDIPPAAHILPVIVGEADNAVRLSQHLRDNGVFAPAIRPPTVPNGTSRIRLSFMSQHGEEEVECVVNAFRSARDKGVIPAAN